MPTIDQIRSDLSNQFNGLEKGQAYFQVYGRDTVIVSFEITFRRNTKEGAFKQYRSHVSLANTILRGIAQTYRGEDGVEVSLHEAAYNPDSEDRYSEYEQDIGGHVEIKIK